MQPEIGDAALVITIIMVFLGAVLWFSRPSSDDDGPSDQQNTISVLCERCRHLKVFKGILKKGTFYTSSGLEIVKRVGSGYYVLYQDIGWQKNLCPSCVSKQRSEVSFEKSS